MQNTPPWAIKEGIDDDSSTDSEYEWFPAYAALLRVTLNEDTRNGDGRYTVVGPVDGLHRFFLMLELHPRNHRTNVVLLPTRRVINIRLSQITRIA